MNIAVYPPFSPFNQYISRMIEAIQYALPSSRIVNFPRTLQLYKFFRIDVVWLNWYENTVQTNNFKEILIKVISLFIIKILGTKIITTFHNKKPHDIKQNTLAKLLFRFIFKFSNRIVVLSSDSIPILEKMFGSKIQNKIYLIPHPTYNCTPKDSHIKNDSFKILNFGLIRPYKNIELILEIARDFPDINFTIAGNVPDNNYLLSLKRKTNSLSNVSFLPHFLSDKEIDELIQSHTIIVLPYNTSSSLNSGSVVHALSKKINVIVPEIGTINMLNNKNDVYHYSYSNETQHLEKLKKTVARAKLDYETNHSEFLAKAERLYNEIIATQSIAAIQKNIQAAFSF